MPGIYSPTGSHEISIILLNFAGNAAGGESRSGLSYLGHYFRRMRAKLGAPKAITAAAHKIARIVYLMLRALLRRNHLGEK
jgi:hypothetical protein